MNQVIIFLSVVLYLFTLFLLIKLESINLEKRILPFIDAKKVKKSFNFNSLFNLNLFNKLENSDALDLINSAEFADLFAVALTSGLNPRSGLEKIINFVPSDF